MLSEISQVVKDKYHMISPISGTQSTKQTSKIWPQRHGNKEQTDSDQKGGKEGEGSSRNMYKEHMDKAKEGKYWG